MRGFDRVARVYDATRSLPPGVMAKVVEGMVAFLGKSSVVDFGVGTGRFAAPLAQAGLAVAGLDISPEMALRARDKGVDRLVLASADAAPFRGGTFDYALVVHFMHLVSDWKAVVGEIARVTKKGLVTVIGDAAGSHPRDLYVELREGMGFEMPGLKLGERQMIAMVKPAETRTLVEYREMFDPSPLLDEYASKLHSITWDMPDKANGKIVAEMRRRLGRKREMARSVSLAYWEREQLRGFDPSA